MNKFWAVIATMIMMCMLAGCKEQLDVTEGSTYIYYTVGCLDKIDFEDYEDVREITIHASERDWDFGAGAYVEIDFQKLNQFPNLETLHFSAVTNLDLSGIGQMAEIKMIRFDGAFDDIRNMNELIELDQLEHLNIIYSGLNDLGFLKGMTSLKTLFIQNGYNVSDFDSIGQLEQLESLYLINSDITDIAFTSTLDGLTSLRIQGGDVTDISALGDLKGLESLELSSLNVTDIDALRHMDKLASITLTYLPITTVEPLAELPNLKTLYIVGCSEVSDLSLMDGDKVQIVDYEAQPD